MVADEFENPMSQAAFLLLDIICGIDMECPQDAPNPRQAGGDRRFFAAGRLGMEQVCRPATEKTRQAARLMRKPRPQTQALRHQRTPAWQSLGMTLLACQRGISRGCSLGGIGATFDTQCFRRYVRTGRMTENTDVEFIRIEIREQGMHVPRGTAGTGTGLVNCQPRTSRDSDRCWGPHSGI